MRSVCLPSTPPVAELRLVRRAIESDFNHHAPNQRKKYDLCMQSWESLVRSEVSSRAPFSPQGNRSARLSGMLAKGRHGRIADVKSTGHDRGCGFPCRGVPGDRTRLRAGTVKL